MVILGVDISPVALGLAQKNLDHNLNSGLLSRRASAEIHFQRADVLGRGDDSIPSVEEVLPRYFSQSGVLSESFGARCDLLISNPPYISTSDFRDGTTSRSVRLFEPRLALIPSAPDSPENAGDRPEDVFYRRILALSSKLQAKITVLECGDMMQAGRVVEMHTAMTSSHPEDSSAEIWPRTEQDLAVNGFHPYDGSRCVIIKRRAR
jgi:methylase of polypeptide subunit release factors